MTHILITGGTGVLGRELVRRLKGAGHTIRIMSRRIRPAQYAPEIEWAQADLATGAGLRAAVSGVATVIHAASDTGVTPDGLNPLAPFFHKPTVDVDGARQLLELARAAGVGHFIHVSIVGIQRTPLAYYQHKFEAERVVVASGVPHTILRATQFHDLVDMIFAFAPRLPWAIMPTDFMYQSIDSGEVADRLIACVNARPAGLLPDMGGPEVQTAGDMLRAWLEAQGRKTRVIGLRAPGAYAAAMRAGLNTCPERKVGKITWAQCLSVKYGGPAS